MQPVLAREFDFLDQKGIEVGKFLIFPALQTETRYTTNALQSDVDKDSDRLLIIAPALLGQMNSGDNEYSFDIKGEQYLYDEFSSQDRLNYDAAARASFGLSSTARLETSIRTLQNHNRQLEEASSNFKPSEPVRYNSNGFLTKLILQPARTKWEFGIAANEVSYQNTTRLSDNSEIVQNDRDRMAYTVSANMVYDADLRFKPSLGLNYSVFDFKRHNFVYGAGYTGVNQDRQRIALIGGVELLPLGKWRGSAKLGLGYEMTVSDQLDDQISYLVDTDLTYLYTPLTNFIFEFDRFFSDDTNATSGVLETRVGASVIHELTRQWLLKGGASYDWRDFQTGQEDETLIGFAGADYSLNRDWKLGGEIEYISRESNRPNGDFDETVVMVRLKKSF